MKKNVKKLLLVCSVTTLMALALTGCAKKTECDVCQEDKMCNEYEVSGFGESEDVWMCKDCYKDIKDEAGDYGLDIEKK